MSLRSALGLGRSDRSRWSWSLRVVLVLAIVVQVVVVTATPTRAQSAEESPEEATVLLLPYLLQPTDAPAGYTLTETTAYPSEAEAFEAVMVPPAHPRPMEALLTQLVNAGRIVRLRQGFENLDDPNAPAMSFAIAAFGTREQATSARNDPSTLLILQPDASVAAIATPPLSIAVDNAVDGVSAFLIDETFDEEEGPQRTGLIAWQRGRLVFTVATFGSPDVVGAALPALAELVARAEVRISAQPALPDQITPGPAYMATAARRLELYKLLADRQVPDDLFGAGLKPDGVEALPNALIVLDSLIADPSLRDPRLVADRLLRSERRILGANKQFDAVSQADDPDSATYPRVSVGHHLYADADGAREAMGASAAEISLRMNEEIYLLNEPTKQVMADTTSAMSMGDQTRTLTGRVMLDDGTEVQVTSVRWRRGAVELFADVAVVAGTDPGDLIQKAVDQLDAAYTSRPLPGM
jgi:hypothetical protein